MGRIMKFVNKINAMAAVLVMFFVFSLFAEDEKTEESRQEQVKQEEAAEPEPGSVAEENAGQKSEESAGIKPEESAVPQAEPAFEESKELQTELSAGESAAAEVETASGAQNESNENIEAEVVSETENFVFSARSLDKMTWNEAVDYCKNLDFYGEKWHLPNIDELRQIVRNCPATEAGGKCRVSGEGNCLTGNCSAPKSDCTCERKSKNRGFYSMFGDADYIGLWSSSTLADNPNSAWGTVFYSGMIGSLGKNSKLYARCVRSFKSKIEVEEEKDEKTGGTAVVILEQGLSDKIVYEYFDKKMDDVSKCVVKGGRGDTDLFHGRIAIDYTISPTGEVVYAAVQMSTAGNLTIENCIAEAVKEIKFPAPKNGKTVEGNHVFTFVLKRKERVLP